MLPVALADPMVLPQISKTVRDKLEKLIEVIPLLTITLIVSPKFRA